MTEKGVEGWRAIAFSGLGMKRTAFRGVAVGGLVTGIIGFVLALIWSTVFVSLL